MNSLLVLVTLLFLSLSYCVSLLLSTSETRSFLIDYDNDTFVKDGEPFRFIAGSFHYFRAVPQTWRRKLRTLRAAGLNAVTTYVEWSLHNPKEGVYQWNGIANLEEFIRLAAEEDLYVILRPGPYICAERDMGGFPYWLLRKYPNIQMRTFDLNYMHEVRTWYDKLMPKMVPFLYGNGGPIMMVQVENEYGSYFTCNRKYQEWLRDLTNDYVKSNAVLFTNDGLSMLKCGMISNVLATLDFGSVDNATANWLRLREYQPKGPLVNAEYYPGWLTHWQERMSRVPINPVLRALTQMLDSGANVNFYMFYGGTNFGFTAGANNPGPSGYAADVTSYDYDAPMNEAGDPTLKYLEIRNVVSRYLPLPKIPVPQPVPKKAYGTFKLTSAGSLLSNDGRKYLTDGVVIAYNPMSFEALDQYSGLLLYETHLPPLKHDPSILKIDQIHDRGYVYVDREFIGTLSRESRSLSVPINGPGNTKLQILVENQGRINFNIMNDFKGIRSDALLLPQADILRNWTMTKYSFDDASKIDQFIDRNITGRLHRHRNRELLRAGPVIFHGELQINAANETCDTYLDPSGWGKGIAFVNGFNLGRYWPIVGPQITLYVPKEILRTGSNRIVLVEYQRAPESGEIRFTDIPNLDGTQN